LNSIIVFTAKNLAKTIEQGGIGNWKLNAIRAKKADYVVLTANSHHRKTTHSKEKHRSAFLVGKISGVSPETYDELGNKEDDRWLIEISEYAMVDIPEVWGGYQNPVKYADIEDLGIKLDLLDWKSFPKNNKQKILRSNIQALTIDEAKQGIAKKMDINPDCIEIIVRA